MTAMKTLENGKERQNEFCQSFFTYKVGKFSMGLAEDYVQRQSTDMVADSAFDAGFTSIAGAMDDALQKNAEPAKATEWLALVAPAGAKLLTALTSWSRLRLEERYSKIQAFLEALVAIVEHAAAIITSQVVAKVRIHIDGIDSALTALEDDDSAVPGDAIHLVQKLAEDAANVEVALKPLRSELIVTIESFEALAGNICKNSKGHTELADFTSNLVEASQAPKSWVDMLWSFLLGLQLTSPIAERTALHSGQLSDYPACLDDLGGDATIELFNQGAPIDLRADAAKKAPLVRCLSALYRCQALVKDELEMPGDDWRRVAECLQADDEVNIVVDWVHEGSLAERIHTQVWVPLRSKMLDGFLKELEIQAT